MNNSERGYLRDSEMAALADAFQRGSARASDALSDWSGRSVLVRLDTLQNLSLAEAAEALPFDDNSVCCCISKITGQLSGQMLLMFADQDGFWLADVLLDRSPGATAEWSELATSAALETANILTCAVLNSLAKDLSNANDALTLLPSPPLFQRDFAESLMQFALMDQAIDNDQVLVTQTRFEVDGTTSNWILLFVPDAASLARLPGLLGATPGSDEDR